MSNLNKYIIDEKGYFIIYNAKNYFEDFKSNFEVFADWVKRFIAPRFNYVCKSITYTIYFDYFNTGDLVLFPTSANLNQIVDGNTSMNMTNVFSVLDLDSYFKTTYFETEMYYAEFYNICKKAENTKEKMDNYRKEGIQKYDLFIDAFQSDYKKLEKEYNKYFDGIIKLTDEQIIDMYDNETLENPLWNRTINKLWDDLKQWINNATFKNF